MKKGTLIRGLICVIGICSLFGLQVHAESEVTVRIYADDDFVASGSVRTLGSQEADRYASMSGQVYAHSKKNATFGIYFLKSNGDWVLSGTGHTCKPGDSFGKQARHGSGNYAYLRIVAGNDMNGWGNKGAIGIGTITGQD